MFKIKWITFELVYSVMFQKFRLDVIDNWDKLLEISCEIGIVDLSLPHFKQGVAQEKGRDLGFEVWKLFFKF